MVAMVLLALSSRLQPGEHYPHYSHGGRESIHSEEFFPIREIVHSDRPGEHCTLSVGFPKLDRPTGRYRTVTLLKAACRLQFGSHRRMGEARYRRAPRAVGSAFGVGWSGGLRLRRRLLSL
jgi:hypothetical protein